MCSVIAYYVYIRIMYNMCMYINGEMYIFPIFCYYISCIYMYRLCNILAVFQMQYYPIFTFPHVLSPLCIYTCTL